MIPYANFTYFAMLLYVAIPTLLIRCWGGRVNRIWILATTILVILVQYLTPTSVTTHLAIHQVWIVLAYAGFQYLVLAIFLRIRRRQLARRQAGADSNSPAVPGASSESSRVPYMMATRCRCFRWRSPSSCCWHVPRHKLGFSASHT